ncbi:Uncharacterised protein [Mycobacteroides abscessus subsp. abscessus]|nr:Uncharacterised protein [Mycobacteroides abscessus subsp. abscessus]
MTEFTMSLPNRPNEFTMLEKLGSLRIGSTRL